jgi:hypothetical protein
MVAFSPKINHPRSVEYLRAHEKQIPISFIRAPPISAGGALWNALSGQKMPHQGLDKPIRPVIIAA